MARFNSKSFAQPDLLKKIHLQNLFALLVPHLTFLQARGFSPSVGENGQFDFLGLAGILAEPDESMSSDLVEAFHVIGNLGTDERFDELLEIAAANGIDTGGEEVTAADLAARIWLHAPQALERKDREALFDRRRKFESFRSRAGDQVFPIEALPTDFSELERDLDSWFEPKKRGVGCKVIRKNAPGEVRFLVQHGEPCRREPSRKGSESTCTFFRPERTDVLIYDLIHNELRVNAGTLSELKLYVAKFGRHLFGDENRFVFSPKYTLEPLKAQGKDALRCRDIHGMEWARLREIQYVWDAIHGHVETQKADDLFEAFAVRGISVEKDPELSKAVFSVKLAAERKPRAVAVRPSNVAEYGRGEEALLIEEWLRARGFIVLEMASDYEKADAAMASV
jgi:hypothetical protein